jgi:hypothetical protein
MTGADKAAFPCAAQVRFPLRRAFPLGHTTKVRAHAFDNEELGVYGSKLGGDICGIWSIIGSLRSRDRRLQGFDHVRGSPKNEHHTAAIFERSNFASLELFEIELDGFAEPFRSCAREKTFYEGDGGRVSPDAADSGECDVKQLASVHGASSSRGGRCILLGTYEADKSCARLEQWLHSLFFVIDRLAWVRLLAPGRYTPGGRVSSALFAEAVRNATSHARDLPRESGTLRQAHDSRRSVQSTIYVGCDGWHAYRLPHR